MKRFSITKKLSVTIQTCNSSLDQNNMPEYAILPSPVVSIFTDDGYWMISLGIIFLKKCWYADICYDMDR